MALSRVEQLIKDIADQQSPVASRSTSFDELLNTDNMQGNFFRLFKDDDYDVDQFLDDAIDAATTGTFSDPTEVGELVSDSDFYDTLEDLVKNKPAVDEVLGTFVWNDSAEFPEIVRAAKLKNDRSSGTLRAVAQAAEDFNKDKARRENLRSHYIHTGEDVPGSKIDWSERMKTNSKNNRERKPAGFLLRPSRIHNGIIRARRARLRKGTFGWKKTERPVNLPPANNIFEKIRRGFVYYNSTSLFEKGPKLERASSFRDFLNVMHRRFYDGAENLYGRHNPVVEQLSDIAKSLEQISDQIKDGTLNHAQAQHDIQQLLDRQDELKQEIRSQTHEAQLSLGEVTLELDAAMRDGPILNWARRMPWLIRNTLFNWFLGMEHQLAEGHMLALRGESTRYTKTITEAQNTLLEESQNLESAATELLASLATGAPNIDDVNEELAQAAADMEERTDSVHKQVWLRLDDVYRRYEVGHIWKDPNKGYKKVYGRRDGWTTTLHEERELQVYHIFNQSITDVTKRQPEDLVKKDRVVPIIENAKPGDPPNIARDVEANVVGFWDGEPYIPSSLNKASENLAEIFVKGILGGQWPQIRHGIRRSANRVGKDLKGVKDRGGEVVPPLNIVPKLVIEESYKYYVNELQDVPGFEGITVQDVKNSPDQDEFNQAMREISEERDRAEGSHSAGPFGDRGLIARWNRIMNWIAQNFRFSESHWSPLSAATVINIRNSLRRLFGGVILGLKTDFKPGELLEAGDIKPTWTSYYADIYQKAEVGEGNQKKRKGDWELKPFSENAWMARAQRFLRWRPATYQHWLTGGALRGLTVAAALHAGGAALDVPLNEEDNGFLAWTASALHDTGDTILDTKRMLFAPAGLAMGYGAIEEATYSDESAIYNYGRMVWTVPLWDNDLGPWEASNRVDELYGPEFKREQRELYDAFVRALDDDSSVTSADVADNVFMGAKLHEVRAELQQLAADREAAAAARLRDGIIPAQESGNSGQTDTEEETDEDALSVSFASSATPEQIEARQELVEQNVRELLEGRGVEVDPEDFEAYVDHVVAYMDQNYGGTKHTLLQTMPRMMDRFTAAMIPADAVPGDTIEPHGATLFAVERDMDRYINAVTNE